MTKPAKPYPDFPLFAHASGHWCKKICGKHQYFGRWKPPNQIHWQEALDEFNRTKDAIYAGRDPDHYNDNLTVKYLFDHFLTHKKRAVEIGDLSQRSFDDYYRTAQKTSVILGKSTPVKQLTPQDFDNLRVQLSRGKKKKQISKQTVSNDIVRIRTIFKYGFEAGLLENTIRFGSLFKQPKRRDIRLEQQQKPVKLFSASEINLLISKANQPLRTMILLGINCALGNSDIGQMRWHHIDGPWLTYPRPKTAVDRRSYLWPETMDLLANIPRDNNSDQALIFKTKYGNSWYKDKSDNPLSKEFRKLQESCKTVRRGRGFYALRHTFETEAGPTLDQAAIDTIMGHEPQHISATYRHGVQDDRLRKVADFMRQWLQSGVKTGVIGKVTNDRQQ